MTNRLVPNPKFQQAFTDLILSQYGRQPTGTTTPTPVDVKPTTPGNTVSATLLTPGFDESYLRAVQRNDPKQTWTYEETGKRSFARQDFNAAFNDYAQALERGDTRPTIYVGYGVSAHGFTALLSMMASCASNVAVVNIDNGFGAGFYAALISRTRRKR